MAKRKGVWCMGVACPWCFFQADHGDYAEAQRQYATKMARGDLQDRPHLAQAAWHAISDLIEQARRNGVDPHMPSMVPPVHAQHVPPLPEMWLHGFDFWHTSGTSSHFKQRTGDAASSCSTEHVSIFRPIGAEAASARVAERSSQDRQHNWPIPPPRAQFQAFGGKRTGWCVYDEAAQEILREAYTRKATAVVQVEHGCRRYSYAVNTDPAVLTQVRSDLRADLHSNVRKVRIVDLWGQLETVYDE